MASQLAFVGLLFTLLGAALLFFYGLPKKRFGNVLILGDTVMTFHPRENERRVPEDELKPIAERFWKRAKTLNSTGFGLVAVGTLLQMVAICVAT